MTRCNAIGRMQVSRQKSKASAFYEASYATGRAFSSKSTYTWFRRNSFRHFSSLTRRSNISIRRTLEKIRKCIFNSWKWFL